MVVDGGDRYVDLGGPVRPISAGRALDELEPLDQIPPERVEVLSVGIGVELALEVGDDERPAGEDEPVGPAPGGQPLGVAVQLGLGDPGDPV